MPIIEGGYPSSVAVPIPGGGTQNVPGTQALVALGPTLTVEVGFDPGFFHPDPVQVQAAIAAAHAAAPGAALVEALIDTGAADCCIDEDLAQQLQLPLIDQQDGSGIGGKEKFNVYLGHIRIAALAHIQYGRFMGVKLAAGGQRHKVLLGRTMLQAMVLIYDGTTGTVRIAR
jgi:predicted aspartyl protease